MSNFLSRLAWAINPKGAASSLGIIEQMQGQGAADSGVSVNAKTAMRISAVWACINVLSDSLAQVPLIVYRRKGKEKIRATDHPLYRLLHEAPNAYLSPFHFFRTMQANRAMHGCGYALIVRGVMGNIIELLPIPSGQITIKQKADWSIEYEWTDGEGKKRILRPEQVFRVPWVTLDGINCLNPIEYHRQSMGVALSSQKHLALSYKNGVKSHGMLIHPTKLSPEARKALQESFDAASGGSNAYKTPVLQEGLKWEPMTISPKDAQYIETMQFEVEDIARIYKVSPHKIGHLLRATFSNIEHLGIEHVVDTMMPHVVAWEQEITRQLIPEKERGEVFVEFLIEGLLRGDSKARADFYSIMLDRAVMSPNEVREKENMNPYEGGDKYERAGNLSNKGGSNNAQVN